MTVSCNKIETAPILSGINQLQKQNDSLLQLVIHLQTSLDSVQNRVNQNTTTLNTINTNVIGLQNSVATLIANITLLKSKMDSANANISSIQLQVTTLAKQYTSLSTQISNVFSLLSNKIDSLSNQTSANTVLLNKLQTEYLITQIKVDSILLQIQINNQLLTTNNTNVAVIQTQLIALTTEYNNVITLLNQLILLINNQSLMPSLFDGLQVWYPFNGNAKDSSGNGWNGTIYGGVTSTTDRFGIANRAYHFDGNSGTHIQTSYPGVLGNLTRSISIWATYPQQAYNNQLLLYYGTIKYGELYGVFINGSGVNQQNIGIDNNGSQVSTVFSNLSDGNWHNYIFVYDSTLGQNVTNIKIYIDGYYFQNSKFYNATNINTISTLLLDIGESSPGQGAYSGNLDEIRIYNRVLTQSEITYLATH